MQTYLTILLKKNLIAKTLLPLFTVIIVSLLFVSCKKGDTGPAGLKGTANVIYSSWFTPATYKKDTIFGTYGFSYKEATADITQKILDSGTVITFGKLNGYNPIIWPTDQVSQLPINLTYLSGSQANIDTWSASLSLGNLTIRLVSSLNAYGTISTAHQFRYVIIPGGTKSTVASVNPGMSYAEICHRLGVPE